MEEEGLPLRRRIPGAARAAPGPSARPVLSEPLLERMQAAIDAAKGPPANQDPEPLTEPIPRIVTSVAGSSETAAPAVNGVSVKRDRAGKPKRAGKRDRDASSPGTGKPGWAARPKSNGHSPGTAGAQPPVEARPQAPASTAPSSEPATARSESPPLPKRDKTAETGSKPTALPQRTPQADRPAAHAQPTALPQRTPAAEPACQAPSPARPPHPQRTPQADRPAAHTQPTALPQRTPAAEPPAKPQPAALPQRTPQADRPAAHTQPTAPSVRTEPTGEPAARTGTRSAPSPGQGRFAGNNRAVSTR